MGFILGLLLILTNFLAVSTLSDGSPTPHKTRASTRPITLQQSAQLDGRLGGTRASFDLAYAGVPVEDTGSGTIFRFEGLGLFLVNFQSRSSDLAADDLAAVITISAPREPGLPADVASPVDWTVEESLEVARRFLPDDVDLSTTGGTTATAGPSEPGTAVASTPRPDEAFPVSCSSATLTGMDFGTGSGAVDCRVALLQPTPASVSFLTLSLGRDEPTVERFDPCEGITDWLATTEETLATVASLVASIQDLDLEAPTASADLTAIADDLREAGDTQAALMTPSPAGRTQAAILDAIGLYVAAIDSAARAIADADDDLLAGAVTQLADATTRYEEAGDLLAIALDTCALSGQV